MYLISLLTATEKQVHLGRRETHTVATQKQLEGSGITGKGDPKSQLPSPPSTMVAKGRQCTHNVKQVNLKARNIPGWLNVVADKLSRLGQTNQME